MKQWTGFEKSSWPDFIDKSRRKAESQIREEDKALYGSGEYDLDKRFQFLQLEPGKWHSLTDKQHLDYRRKARSSATFEKAYMAKYVTATTGTGTHSTASQSALTVDIAIGSVGRIETEGLLRIVLPLLKIVKSLQNIQRGERFPIPQVKLVLTVFQKN